MAPFLQACGGRMRLQTVNKFGLSGELTLAARYHKSLLNNFSHHISCLPFISIQFFWHKIVLPWTTVNKFE
jgi:hypothetical protein